MKYSHHIFNFLQEISSVSHSLFSSISLHCSLKAFLHLLAILWNSAFSWVYLSLSCLFLLSFFFLLFFSQVFVKPHQATTLPSCFFFFFLQMVLVTSCCTVLWTSVHSSPDTLPDLIPWLYSSPPFYNHKGFDEGYIELPSCFPYLFQFKPEFCNKGFMIWATGSSRSCFCWLNRVFPSSTAKNIISLISVLAICWCPCVDSRLVLLKEGVCYHLIHISSHLTIEILDWVESW